MLYIYYNYRIYYDHGDSSLSEVLEPKVFLGEEYNLSNHLSDVDIVFIDTKNNVAKIIVEVEESEVYPKKFISDIFSILIADKIRIKEEEDKEQLYSLNNTFLFLILNTGGSSYRKQKISKISEEIKIMNNILKNNKYKNNITEIKTIFVSNKIEIPKIDLNRIFRYIL